VPNSDILLPERKNSLEIFGNGKILRR
ncbi:uncharacterized protein METZ01_LOCUS131571, partial [marine metagenome]